MNDIPSFSDRIIRIYLLGASVLLAFYLVAFHAGILLTENALVERRLEIVAPFYFEQYASSLDTVVPIDPVLTLYKSYAALPPHIQSKVTPNWEGTQHLLLEDEQEFQLIALAVVNQGARQMFYAVEDSNALEWDDAQFVLTEVLLGLIGLMMFLITTAYMFKAARRMASPFRQVAEKLQSDSLDNFENIYPNGDKTSELSHIVIALNAYRQRLKKQSEREQSFTRYVSHELRTPMMVIKGAVSNLRRSPDANAGKSIEKISRATDQMQDLTQTFLFLARDGEFDDSMTRVSEDFVDQLRTELESMVAANHINFQFQLASEFDLVCHPQLLKAVLNNLLKNAFACSVKGKVILMLSEKRMDVIDDGVGLDSKPRGYEGFGIGLVLVEDICSKYGWKFQIQNNPTQGCTASVIF